MLLAYFVRAQVYIKQQKFQEAIDDFTKFLEESEILTDEEGLKQKSDILYWRSLCWLKRDKEVNTEMLGPQVMEPLMNAAKEILTSNSQAYSNVDSNLIRALADAYESADLVSSPKTLSLIEHCIKRILENVSNGEDILKKINF